jgi:hypothetical protein
LCLGDAGSGRHALKKLISLRPPLSKTPTPACSPQQAGVFLSIREFHPIEGESLLLLNRFRNSLTSMQIPRKLSGDPHIAIRDAVWTQCVCNDSVNAITR